MNDVMIVTGIYVTNSNVMNSIPLPRNWEFILMPE